MVLVTSLVSRLGPQWTYESGHSIQCLIPSCCTGWTLESHRLVGWLQRSQARENFQGRGMARSIYGSERVFMNRCKAHQRASEWRPQMRATFPELQGE